MNKILSRLKSLAVSAVRALRRAVLRAKAPGRVRYGREFIVGPRPSIARGTHLHVGNRVSIAGNFICAVDLTVGDDVMIGANVAFVGNDHHFDDPALSIREQGNYPVNQVRMMGDNIIGIGTIVLGNVTIGHGCLVGAGSLVTKDLPPDTFCYGRPAKPMRMRR